MKQIAYSQEKIVEVLATLEEIVVSLDRIGAGAHAQSKEEYHATIEAFIRQHEILRKAAKARQILSEPFSTSPGPDGMDELERKMQTVPIWIRENK